MSWNEYDSLGRTISRTSATADDYVPELAAGSLTPSTGGDPAVSLAVSSQHYNSNGQLYQMLDPELRVSDIEYDSFTRPYRRLAPVANGTRDQTTTHYDTLGRAWKREARFHDPEGQPHVRSVEAEFDGWGRVNRTVHDPGGENRINDYSYDAFDRVTTKATRWQNLPPSLPALHAQDRATQVLYDAVGRLSETHVRNSISGWAVTRYGYDDDGRPSMFRDPRGNETNWQYDDLGRLERTLYPQSGEFVQTAEYRDYDLRGLPGLIEHRQHNADTTVRVTWDLDYDNYGRLNTRTAVLENADPSVPVFTGTIEHEFEFDALGRIVRATDRSDGAEFPFETELIVERQYDTLSRLRIESQWLPVDGSLVEHRVESTYDAAGFRRVLDYPEEFDATGAALPRYRLTHSPDTRGRLEKIQGASDPANPASTVVDLARFQYAGGRLWLREYPSNGIELRFFGNGAHQAKPLEYDGLGRTRRMSTVESASPHNVLAGFQYGFDRVGNLTYEQRLHEPIGTDYRTRAMTSDHRRRLTQWTEGPLPANPVLTSPDDPASEFETPTDAEGWTLDDAGNWTSHSSGVVPSVVTREFSSANPLNQYTDVDDSGGEEAPKSFDYDWLGQMREDSEGNRTYSWDLFGRLTEVHNATTGSLIARYRYDAFNRRVEKYAPSSGMSIDATTQYFYDGWRAIEERGVVIEGGEWRDVVRARYGFGLGMDDVLWMDRDVPRTGGSADPILGSTNGSVDTRYFVHHDLAGSAVAITEEGTGDLVERYVYSAYGNPGILWDASWNGADYGAAPSKMSRVGYPFLYTGQRFDAESGLHYYKNRYLDSRVGRFLQRDPLGYADGSNVYQYARSNPIISGDPLGLASEEHRRNTSSYGGPDPGRRRGGGRGCGKGVQWRSCEDFAKETLGGRAPGTPPPARESEIEALQRKIGQLTIENDFLSKAFGR